MNEEYKQDKGIEGIPLITRFKTATTSYPFFPALGIEGIPLITRFKTFSPD